MKKKKKEKEPTTDSGETKGVKTNHSNTALLLSKLELEMMIIGCNVAAIEIRSCIWHVAFGVHGEG